MVLDTALFLGDVRIRRNPHLHWAFYVGGKRDIGYQKPVIMGFKDAPTRYYVDIDRLVATQAHRIVAGDDVERDMFVKWVPFE